MSKFKKRMMMPGGPKEVDGSGFTVLSGLSAIFEIGEVRKKVLITLFILFIYRLGAHIPVPGIDIKNLASAVSATSNGILDFIDLFAGGAFKRYTIFALGIMPYISAEIIMQLLMSIIPKWAQMMKDDQEAGKEFMQFWSRSLTIILSAAQAFVFTKYVVDAYGSSQTRIILMDSTLLFYFVSVFSISTGTMFLIWLGDKIDDYGIGNGASMIIFSGIIARMPSAMNSLFKSIQRGDLNIITFVVVLAIFVGIIILIIYVQRGKRKLPVGGSKSIKGGKIAMIPAISLSIPLNPAGVIPIIFSSVFLQFPVQIIGMLGGAGKSVFLSRLQALLMPGNWMYMFLDVALIMAFTYFYSSITLNPNDMSEYLRKSGRTLRGQRAGGDAQIDIKKTIRRIILPGAIFLAFIAAIPNLAMKLIKGIPQDFSYIMGGTSILIVAGVAFDVATKLESVRRFRNRG